MTRLVYGELGNGKYGCSEFPFIGKQIESATGHSHINETDAVSSI